MFTFLKSKTPPGNQITFKIDGMHCTSCAMNIDGELEDIKGVIRAETSYAKSKTTVTYDSTQITPTELKSIISALHYAVSEISN